jgi:hypothetical protein
MGNYPMALGNIYEAELINKDMIKLKHIKAIVQYHSGNNDIAETILRSLANKDSTASFNYRLLALSKSTANDNITLEKFKGHYAVSLKNKTSTLNNCNKFSNIVLRGRKSKTKINDNLTITSEITGNYSQIRINRSNKIIEVMITNEKKTGNEINTGNFKFIDPNYGCLVFTNSFSKIISYKVK